jgi:pilus assembly protein CpaF
MLKGAIFLGLFNISRTQEVVREAAVYEASDNPITDRRELKRLMLSVMDYMNTQNMGNLLNTENGNSRQAREKLRQAVSERLERMQIFGEYAARQVYEELVRYLWGYYVLDDLVNDREVSDIRVLEWNYVRYKKRGVRQKAEITFLDREDYLQFVSLLSVRHKKSLNDLNAITYFTDQTGNSRFILRINICTAYVCNQDSPILIIRKIPKEKYTIEQLIERKMLDRQLAAYLVERAKNAQGMIFTGKGASGKTTLLNTLLEHIDEGQSGVVIQENDELFISEKTDKDGKSYPSRDLAFLHTVQLAGEGKIEYTLEELTRNGLRMDLDYFVIGEIKGNEAAGFSMASYTGHKCWATVHGMNSYEGINKLADYIKQATGYSFTDCLKKLIGIEVVVFMRNFKVEEVTEIRGFDEKTGDLVKKCIYRDGRFVNDGQE